MHSVTTDDGAAADEPRRATRPLSTAVKLLALLDVLADVDEPVRVSSLARVIGASRAEVHRQLVTLEAAGWMEQLPDDSYRLTLRPAHLGHTALRQAGIGERTAPMLADTARACGDVVSIAVLDAATARVVQRAEPGRGLYATLLLGDRLDLASSATGRLLCALADARTAAELEQAGVALPGPEERALIRATGWATSTDDDADGIAAVAVPLCREDGPPVAALSLHGPRERITATGALAVLRPLAHRIEPLLRLDSGAPFGLHG
ncbi:IclR family transcriptional regulator [Streptomyces sp. NPDC090106]|uniref:IclR family transcriptional regulator n=1 Tax=Streptomyces sp. NPDC090106 TaxID=3365946 RepID=UPI00381857FE